MSYPNECPKCRASFRGDPIPKSQQEAFGRAAHFNRAILVKLRSGRDRWKCPDCGHEWEAWR